MGVGRQQLEANLLAAHEQAPLAGLFALPPSAAAATRHHAPRFAAVHLARAVDLHNDAYVPRELAAFHSHVVRRVVVWCGRVVTGALMFYHRHRLRVRVVIGIGMIRLLHVMLLFM